jgi:hypothetical protein
VPWPADVEALRAEVRNWGRWGDDDEVGTLNLITDDVVRAGVAEINAGKRFPLALPLDADGPQMGFTPGRDNPVHFMTGVNDAWPPGSDMFSASDDKVTTSLQAATHWDALSHVSSGGVMYNAIPADAVTDGGAARLGIERVGALVGRAVLLDVARARGVDAIVDTHAVTGDDLDAACELGKLEVRPGDVVLLRTGKMTQFLAGDKLGYAGMEPGCCRACAGSARTTSRPSPPTTTTSRCSRASARTRSSRSTSCTSSTWA